MTENQHNIAKKSQSGFLDFLPPATLSLVQRWLDSSPVQVKLVAPRRTKTGDFRVGRILKHPLITLNRNLHPVEMLITFCHELAHHRVHSRYVIRRKPHGKEWKAEYRLLLKELLDSRTLDHEINQAIERCFFRRERIGSGGCQWLHRVLHPAGDVVRVMELKEGQAFVLRGGRAFVLGSRIRTRYRCRELSSGKIFTIHPMAEVSSILDGDVGNLLFIG